jgi:hypothetical protein
VKGATGQFSDFPIFTYRKGETMYYDDNFGVYDIHDEDDIAFYHQVQAESIEKVCTICGRTVRLRPGYDKCNSCADAIEKGLGY